ncbi:hypothetical protein B0H21DRAFT_576243 [Amylocystis lapponica]|nr:hypothetical protein B0H21DRAFT_576243 [Amylocystis lapponica]
MYYSTYVATMDLFDGIWLCRKGPGQQAARDGGRQHAARVAASAATRRQAGSGTGRWAGSRAWTTRSTLYRRRHRPLHAGKQGGGQRSRGHRRSRLELLLGLGRVASSGAEQHVAEVLVLGRVGRVRLREQRWAMGGGEGGALRRIVGLFCSVVNGAGVGGAAGELSMRSRWRIEAAREVGCCGGGSGSGPRSGG